MYEFCYGYVKLKYREKAKLCYMDADCFIIFIVIKHIYVEIAKDVEIRFVISKYEVERPLLRGNKLLD